MSGTERPPRRRQRRWDVGLQRAAIVILVLAIAAGAAGWALFTRAGQDPLTHADAIVVLGGEHDGRERYGIELAERGYANTVVLSNPYSPSDPLMRELCAASTARITVLCEAPIPSTTRGEALFTRRLADQNGWHSVLVVSWQYHLPRARYIFHNCFGGRTTMRAVPRDYDFSVADWGLVYAYQAFGTIKAAVQGGC